MYNVQFGDLQFAVVDNALGFTYAALNTAWFYQTDIYAETEYALQAGHKLLLQSQHLVDFVGIVFGTNSTCNSMVSVLFLRSTSKR